MLGRTREETWGVEATPWHTNGGATFRAVVVDPDDRARPRHHAGRQFVAGNRNARRASVGRRTRGLGRATRTGRWRRDHVPHRAPDTPAARRRTRRRARRRGLAGGRSHTGGVAPRRDRA